VKPEDIRRMNQQFGFTPAPLVDLGLFCFELDPAHWKARQHLDEKVMVGSTGGPWAEFRTRERFAALKETWKNDVLGSVKGFVEPCPHSGVGLQALVARTLGQYLEKEVRATMGKRTDSLETLVLDDSIRDCTPGFCVLRKGG